MRVLVDKQEKIEGFPLACGESQSPVCATSARAAAVKEIKLQRLT
jgi:hypothetical protein